jgi:DNA replication initiation complex subunit (GINS family)
MSVDLPGKVYNLLKRELIEEGLQPLEPDFYKTVINAMKTLKPESPLRENLWQTIRILFLLRLKKEVDILLRGETDKLKGIPQEEREVITKILETIEMEKSRPIAQQMAARPLVEEEVGAKELKTQGEGTQRTSTCLVVFLKPYASIIDKDFKGGPFRKGDIALIPRRIAVDLERDNYVEIIGD